MKKMKRREGPRKSRKKQLRKPARGKKGGRHQKIQEHLKKQITEKKDGEKKN